MKITMKQKSPQEMQRQSVTHPPQTSLQAVATLNKKTNHTSPPFFIADRDVIWHVISLWSIWASYPAYFFFQLLLAQPTCWGGRVRERESPDAVQAQHWCVITTALVTNPKHSTNQRKINFIPARPSTCIHSIPSMTQYVYLSICTSHV